MRLKDRNTSSNRFANKVSEYGNNYGIFEIYFEMRKEEDRWWEKRRREKSGA